MDAKFNEDEILEVKEFLDHISGLLNSEYTAPKYKDEFNKVYRLVYDKTNGAPIKNYWYRRNWDNSLERFSSLEVAEKSAIKREMGEVTIYWCDGAVKKVDGEAYYA